MEELINEHLELYRERPRNSVKDFRSSLDERLQKFFDQREEDLEFECLENIEKYWELKMPKDAWTEVIKSCSKYLK